MRQRIIIAVLGLLAAFSTVPALCAGAPGIAPPTEVPNPNDPTVSQVYDAARAGNLEQAKQMITQVLANHPSSARAHYVAAQLDADMKNYAEARQELKRAEELAPGLPLVPPQVLADLRKQIGAPAPAAAAEQTGVMRPSASAEPATASSAGVAASAKPFPWRILWVVAAVLVFLWLLFRRRRPPAPVYASNTTAMPGATPPPGGFPNVVAGGSGIVGGLASGLAVGAGIAAGEELVRHEFESHHEAGAGVPAPEPHEGAGNSDLGGHDFGLSDPGGSWDDGGASSGDDGGGDWT